MVRKKFIAIHTYHSDEMKKAFWKGNQQSTMTDIDWRDGYIFDNCQCTATWVGNDDFFFCQWEAQNAQDVLDVLTEKGLDEYIFTALYEIDMHIDVDKLTGEVPYKPIHYLDPEHKPETA